MTMTHDFENAFNMAGIPDNALNMAEIPGNALNMAEIPAGKGLNTAGVPGVPEDPLSTAGNRENELSAGGIDERGDDDKKGNEAHEKKEGNRPPATPQHTNMSQADLDELAAMGWSLPATCRPTAPAESPARANVHGHPQALSPPTSTSPALGVTMVHGELPTPHQMERADPSPALAAAHPAQHRPPPPLSAQWQYFANLARQQAAAAAGGSTAAPSSASQPAAPALVTQSTDASKAMQPPPHGVQPTPDPQKPIAPAHPKQAVNSTPGAIPANANQSAPPGGSEYSRRAAANLINRLVKNPGRLESLPSLKGMVFDERKKSELITALVDSSGDLHKANAFFQMQEEKGKAVIARKKALRLTKKQMQDTYGDEAEKVMKHKENTGMTEADENCPDSVVYLVAQKEDEHEDFHRSST